MFATFDLTPFASASIGQAHTAFTVATGVLRQYFPNGTDLARSNRSELEAVAAAINSRPRKILG